MTAPAAPAPPLSPPASSSDADLAGRLRAAASRIAREGLGQKQIEGMTPSRVTALAVLVADGPLRMGELACRLGISAPTASRMVECLVDMGLLLRETDAEDHRATRVHASSDGHTALAAVRAHGAGVLAARIAGLDPDERRVLALAVPLLESLAHLP